MAIKEREDDLGYCTRCYELDKNSRLTEHVIGRQGSIRSVRWFLPVGPSALHIAYLDESGTHTDARYFVVASICVFERETYFLAQKLDQIQATYLPQESGQVYFHASELRAQSSHLKPPFDSLTAGQRRELIDDIYSVIAESRATIFAVAMEKKAMNVDPYEYGFEQIVSRFDRMLGRTRQDRGERQRGLVVIAESSYRENLERLARQIWSQGHHWGATYNMADIPYFAPAKQTRLLQLADFVCNAVYGFYEHGYAKNFQKIAQKFDQEGPQIHGLVHVVEDRSTCFCPACVSRRT